MLQTELTKVKRLRFSGDSRFIVIGDAKTANGQEGYEVWDLPPHNRAVYRASAVVLRSMEWDPNKAELYVPRMPHLDILAPTGQLLQTLPNVGLVRGTIFSSAGDWLITCSPFRLDGRHRLQDRWVPQWSIENSVDISRNQDSFTSAASFSDDQRIVVLIGHQHLVPYTNRQGQSAPYLDWKFALVQRDLTTGQVLVERSLDRKEYPLGVRRRLAVTPDGSAVIGFRARSVYAWPTDSTKPAHRVSVARKDIWDVALHPSGRWLLVVCDNSEVSVWNTVTWKSVRTYDWGIGRVQCVAISPDGFLAAVGSHTGRVAIWDWES